jgi:hypothetical protein
LLLVLLVIPLLVDVRVLALESLGPVATTVPEPRLEQPVPARIEHGGTEIGALVDERVGETLRVGGHGRFRGRVHAEVGKRLETAVTGRRVHDPSFLTALDHARDERRDAVAHTEEVHTEAPRPVVGCPVPGLRDPAAADTCVVEQQMTHAVLVVHLLGARFDRLGLRHVGDDARHLALAVELAERLVEDRLLDVGDDDLRVLLEECAHQALPDAARTTGDNGNLAREILH